MSIQWSGTNNGSTQTIENPYIITNLEPGTYTVLIEDQNTCTASQTTTINSTSLWAIPTVENGNCEDLASVDLFISGGTPLYSISWTGPVVGFGSSNEARYTLNNLISGDYSISVTDANSCSTVVEVNIENSNENQTPNAQFNYRYK